MKTAHLGVQPSHCRPQGRPDRAQGVPAEKNLAKDAPKLFV